MPDWFYRPVAKPLLFCLPDKVARRIALGTIGTLGRSAVGRVVIDFLGHMQPDPRLVVCVGGTEFPSSIGVGWRVDPECWATRAWPCLGAGCVEVRADARQEVWRGSEQQLCDRAATSAPDTSLPRAEQRLLIRRRTGAGDETLELPSGIILNVRAWDGEVLPQADEMAAGVVLQVGVRMDQSGWQVPTAMPRALPELVTQWRQRLRSGAILIVAGGVGCPSDARAIMNAGADLVLVDAGIVFRGPGLLKRCNEALLLRGPVEKRTDQERGWMRQAWFWVCVLGVAMMFGGTLTLGLAFTRVLLPYDEHYLGFTAHTLELNSPRLFAFMAHDRGTLAGTMIGLGYLYFALGWQGVKRGVHGVRTAVIASALVGFASFFAFFGFGYFDTLHAFVAALLFQITVQIMVGAVDAGAEIDAVVDTEDAGWRRAQWGQLLWILHSVGLVIAGIVILGIGVSSVFVSEDLSFLCLTETQAQALGTRTLGVIAHDRATLGGMLLAAGVAMLLPVLWGCRKRASWLWWAVLGLGAPSYLAAIGIHFEVGYTDWRHLGPAFVGAGLWVAGLLLSRAYLLSR